MLLLIFCVTSRLRTQPSSGSERERESERVWVSYNKLQVPLYFLLWYVYFYRFAFDRKRFLMFESSKVQLNFTLSFSEQHNSLTIHIRDVIRRIFCCCRHLLYSECNIRHFHVNSFNTALISLILFSCGKMSQVQVFVFACEW